MAKTSVIETANPVIPVRDMGKSLTFYYKLGFVRTFDDSNGDETTMSYAGVSRDNVCIHLQKMNENENPTSPLIRIQVRNTDTLYGEFLEKDLGDLLRPLESKPWGSRDFGVYDPDRAALVFYEDM